MGQLPHIAKAYDRFHQQGFEVVNYSLDSDRAAMEAARKKYRVAGLLAIDPDLRGTDDEVAKQMFVHGLPTAYLVSSDGTIVAREWMTEGERIEQVLDEFFAAQPF